jgi:hypothetical protein
MNHEGTKDTKEERKKKEEGREELANESSSLPSYFW